MSESNTPTDETEKPKESFFKKIRSKLIGRKRNPFDPKVFHNLSLIAFFAWVGLGADGLSSANYGPEEAFLALHGYSFLVPVLAIIIAAIVLVISASYSQVIEQFPSGGGGYVVASKLLGPKVGVISGAALIIDYVLTIAVSATAGAGAIFSLLPPEWDWMKTEVAILAVIILIIMNLRGVKESVLTLLPIFMIFIITHVGLVTYGLFTHMGELPTKTAEATLEFNNVLESAGWFAILWALLHAVSMGAGTLTGIEAVANGMAILKEPRIKTGKRTMLYMAVSLSFLAAMLLINFFLFESEHAEGKTLNAVLFSQITEGWKAGGIDFGNILIWIMLISASLLLFVAAQTGFIDGPRVLGNMAEDSWLPHKFAHLSERLVTQNGVLLMGLGSIALILYAHGSINLLVNLYAIDVFICFSLTQLGMSKHWFSQRKGTEKWQKKFIISGIGFIVCFVMLIIMCVLKFNHGGWLVLLITFGLASLCFWIHKHYLEIQHKVESLDEILGDLTLGDAPITPQKLDPTQPTAVVLVQKYGGVGVHVLLNVQRLFGFRFKQYIFLSVGAIDSGAFKGVDELSALTTAVNKDTEKYVQLARSYGLMAEARTSFAIDYITEIENLCIQVNREFPNSVFFAGRLLFWKDTFWSRILHNDTPMFLQRRMLFHGIQFVVLPVRLQ